MIGNSPSGCGKRSNCFAFRAADIMVSHLCLIIASIGLILGINLPQRLKRKVHSYWHLVVSAPFRLPKNKEEIARNMVIFCNQDSPAEKFLSGTSLPMLPKLMSALKQENFVVVFISKSASSLYAPRKTHIQLSYGRTEVRSHISFCEVIQEMFHILNCGFEIK